MLRGLTIQQLAAKIAGNQALKRDVVHDTRKMFMDVVPGEADEKTRLELRLDGDSTFPILPLAHDQIADRTRIPTRYYDRMRNEAPALLASNVNHWFHERPERRMIRTIGGEARAFLSDRYQRIDNEQIASAALPVLADFGNALQIVSSEITDKRLYIQFVVRTLEGEAKVGDIVQAGGVISNSEVGLGSVSVSALLWRLACLNGMKTSDTLRRTHIGRRVEEGQMDEIAWSEDTLKADDEAIMLKVRDMVRNVVDETAFRVRLGKVQQLAGSPPIENPIRAVEVLQQKLPMILDGDRGGILAALVKGGDLSAWALTNAVTAQAHTALSYDRAVEIEEIGGQMLELADGDWREILAAK